MRLKAFFYLIAFVALSLTWWRQSKLIELAEKNAHTAMIEAKIARTVFLKPRCTLRWNNYIAISRDKGGFWGVEIGTDGWWESTPK